MDVRRQVQIHVRKQLRSRLYVGQNKYRNKTTTKKGGRFYGLPHLAMSAVSDVDYYRLG